MLSAGNGGQTWRAHDSVLNREVVVKFAEDGESVQRVSDYIEGNELSALRGQEWRRIVPLAAQVAEALAALHARGAAHGDVKSSNVIVRPEGSIALIDALPDGGSPALSPYSASPQQHQGASPTPADDAYAFGVLLYELLSNHPPFYPDITRERVLTETPPPLQPVHPIPDVLRDLIMQLLAKDPDKRPQKLADVAATLRALALSTSPGEVGKRSAELGEQTEAPTIIVRPIVRPAAERRAEATAARTGSSMRSWFIGLSFAVLAAIAIAVFVLLPRFVPQHVAKQAAPAAPPAQPAKPAPPPEIDYLAMAEAMDKAEQARNAYEAMYKVYEQRGAEQWASASFLAARAQGEAGRQHFEKREYAASEQNYREGLASLQEVVNIAKRNEEAARQAKAQEEARKAAEAAAERARVAANEFATGMSEGMRLLAAGKLDEARVSFNRAGRVRPNAPEVTDALAQVARAEQRQKIASAQKRGQELEASERWAEAMAEYESALKLDSSLEFARAGRDRVAPQLALHNQLDQIVTNPQRLLSASVRKQAHALLAQARQVPSPGPVLQQQTTQLAEELKHAETPMKVALESDGATTVVINRVARLGAFDTRELELLPGKYTVVGTRPGYRDVRRELAVLPGKAPQKLIVRCEEPI